ncbi:hypothetical protein Cgig2_005527 [Carnegiea gigantea]|uniref:Uncharacterized protein n=1 Tax=Carnegiea gigantea TaxID=171969 RepID=A0A9Q1GJN0_9CARY|nr:hypothetical protein Cgig2_005527 [Carnegiea gigantea]
MEPSLLSHSNPSIWRRPPRLQTRSSIPPLLHLIFASGGATFGEGGASSITVTFPPLPPCGASLTIRMLLSFNILWFIATECVVNGGAYILNSKTSGLPASLKVTRNPCPYLTFTPSLSSTETFRGLIRLNLLSVYLWWGLLPPTRTLPSGKRIADEWYIRAILVGFRVENRFPTGFLGLYRNGLWAGWSALFHPPDPRVAPFTKRMLPVGRMIMSIRSRGWGMFSMLHVCLFPVMTILPQVLSPSRNRPARAAVWAPSAPPPHTMTSTFWKRSRWVSGRMTEEPEPG